VLRATGDAAIVIDLVDDPRRDRLLTVCAEAGRGLRVADDEGATAVMHRGVVPGRERR
jgi:hypothetical protein